MRLKRRFGLHQQIHIQPFVVDRTNLFTGRVEYHVEEDFDRPSANYMSLGYGATIAGMSGISGMAKGTATQPVPSCVGVERRYDNENSMAVYTYTFEGIATSHGERFIEFELEFTMNQEPIETHPSFPELQVIFGPYDPLNRLWQPHITQAAANVGLQQTTGGGPVTNPMYGVTSYLSPGLIYRMSYTDVDVDPDFMDHVGTIVIPPIPEELFPQLQGWIQNTGFRNWLKLAPKIRQHGSCITVIEEYMLSGPRGWADAVYSEDALKGQAL